MFDVVYFSSVSENTKRFVEKLGIPSYRIPLQLSEASAYTHDRDAVLITPTYGGGNDSSTVPKQVIKFLNNPENRKRIKAVIAGAIQISARTSAVLVKSSPASWECL